MPSSYGRTLNLRDPSPLTKHHFLITTSQTLHLDRVQQRGGDGEWSGIWWKVRFSKNGLGHSSHSYVCCARQLGMRYFARQTRAFVRREHIKNAAVLQQYAGTKKPTHPRTREASIGSGHCSFHETESWIPLTLLSRRLLMIDGS